EQAEARFGRLDGVVHAAGITDPRWFGLAQALDRAACQQHFRPKVDGLYVLERLLEGRQLDFCLLMSSLSAVLGGLGFAAYAAALADRPLQPRPALATPYAAPSGQTEERIAALWEATLGLGPVGVHDNFLELGGHSLMATQLMARIRTALGVDLPLTCLIEGPT